MDISISNSKAAGIGFQAFYALFYLLTRGFRAAIPRPALTCAVRSKRPLLIKTPSISLLYVLYRASCGHFNFGSHDLALIFSQDRLDRLDRKHYQINKFVFDICKVLEGVWWGARGLESMGLTRLSHSRPSINSALMHVGDLACSLSIQSMCPLGAHARTSDYPPAPLLLADC